ncbi:Hypothetical lipoprotein YajG precursor [Klebsiella pneumoniae IS39]|nr:Hypothetical lipoprotein YajG precursor [Klebsiella pneumoniae IS39]
MKAPSRPRNKNIADAVNSVLTDTIADMAQDTSIHDFIKQKRALMLSRTRPPPGSCFMLCPVITYAFFSSRNQPFC